MIGTKSLLTPQELNNMDVMKLVVDPVNTFNLAFNILYFLFFLILQNYIMLNLFVLVLV